MTETINGEPAGRLRRLLATLIDAIIVPSVTLFLVMVFGVVEHAEDFIDWWWTLHVLGLAILSYLLLNGYLLWRRGQTLGKKLLGLAIVNSRMNPEGGYVKASIFKLVLIRAWAFPLMFIGIVPYFTILPLADILFIFSKQRRCLHDYLCGTSVIRIARERSQ